MGRKTRWRHSVAGGIALGMAVAGGVIVGGPHPALATTDAWNETSPAAVSNGAPSGIVKVLTGDVTGDGVPDQVAITSDKHVWVGTYTAPGNAAALTWSDWTPPTVSGLSLTTLEDNTYLGAGDPLRQLGLGTNPVDPVIRDGLTIIVPAAESGDNQPEYWYYHSFGTGFEAPIASYTGAYLADEVLTGDFNGDGRMDFLLINNSTDQWQVVLGWVNSTTGAQEYLPAATWLTGYGIGTYDVVGDFTGDGVDDVAQFYNGSWRVARGSPTISENSFTYETWLTGVSTPDAVRVGNFTGTGIDSIVDVYNSGNWSVLTSQAGSGTHAFVSHSAVIGISSPKFLMAADSNGDGLTDLQVVTSTDTPELVLSSYDPTSDTPTLTVQASAISLGAVADVYTTFYDPNDSADLFLETATGDYFLTANNAFLATSQTIHLNRPIRGPNNTTCNSGDPQIFCGFYSDRIQFYLPGRLAFYVQSIQFNRDYGTFTGRSIGDSCFYIYPKRYTVGATNDQPGSPNREEACDTVEKGTGEPVYGTAPVNYPGNGVLVPAGINGRIEVQSSAYTSPTAPAAPVLEHFTAVIRLAGASASNLGWILRLPEADTSQSVGGGTESAPNVVTLNVVPYGGSSTDNHTEWGNSGTCNQYVTGVSFYNSFDQSPDHTEAQLGMYVKHPNGTQDNYTFSPREYKGDDGTVSGSYTSRNPVYFQTPITIAPGDIVGVTTTHYNYGSFVYNADDAYYLLMQKATDTNCSP